MARLIRITESNLRDMIASSVRNILSEAADYSGEDLTNQESLVTDAEDAIYRLERGGFIYGWMDVAEEMGFDLETLNGPDLENLKDAIEVAMMETYEEE